jgi:hypothetical protein
MIRERQIQSATFSAGTTQTVDLPRDAVYHMIQLSVRQGTITQAVADSGVGSVLSDCFPFNIIKNLRLVRNGSDVVWQGSGTQLSKEHLFLNKSHPYARLYTTTTNVDTVLTLPVYQGITVPANSQGIGEAAQQFALAPTAATTAATSSITYFDFLMELWLQLGVDDIYYGSLIDARKLASYQLELQYAATGDVMLAGTLITTTTIAATIQVSSYDQDNLDVKEQFGTFKRSSLSLNNVPYGSTNQQILLPRGNYFHGIIIETLAQKAQSATVLRHESGVLGQINNRINSNYTLRATTFKDLGSKHLADNWIDCPYNTTANSPNGFAYLSYPMAGKRGAELVPTYVMDQFDLQIATNASTAAENTADSASTNPTIVLLLQEVIPGVSIGNMAPKGAFAGSSRATSTKPYSS